MPSTISRELDGAWRQERRRSLSARLGVSAQNNASLSRLYWMSEGQSRPDAFSSRSDRAQLDFPACMRISHEALLRVTTLVRLRIHSSGATFITPEVMILLK
jgi:hypothetical protein